MLAARLPGQYRRGYDASPGGMAQPFGYRDTNGCGGRQCLAADGRGGAKPSRRAAIRMCASASAVPTRPFGGLRTSYDASIDRMSQPFATRHAHHTPVTLIAHPAKAPGIIPLLVVGDNQNGNAVYSQSIGCFGNSSVQLIDWMKFTSTGPISSHNGSGNVK